ncbi:cytochrome P450 [Actinophytocola algeriensis]|uniref:Cytochrome P450 n=1 Tax=Actinophytocola algeriensis TaxID=1768010 RepID=A0A7W7Q9M7_9PSEU|nr:cytochrome P450 [Actinophytocola algeriensis]MBB4909423.1 cytochrome P450 [Actinophytocola algeriensis]MBE1475413.1 cytochrome P450 [Actinophytocola algeriensis]
MIGFSTAPSTTVDSRGGTCMYSQIDTLRAQGPAVAAEFPEGFRAWVVTRGEVVRRLLPHPGVSRDLKKNVPGYEPGEVKWLSPWVDVESMSTAEGREHQRLRELVAPALTPERIDAMRPRLEEIAANLLDDLETRPPDEPLDLHTAYSQQLPTRLQCDLYGVPEDLRPEVLRILRVVLNTDNVPAEESAAVFTDMNVAMRTLIDLKRREPADDLTSFLLAARLDGEAPLSEQELVDMLFPLIGDGSQTTVSLIDHTVRELLANPDQLKTVLADPSRIDRENEEHIAFGAGPHFCPGARLARLAAHVAVPALFARFPDLALAVAPDEVRSPHSFIANDVAALPVVLRHRAVKAA